MPKKKKTSGALKVFEGALIGAVIGVAAGMFISSPKGKKMRKDVEARAAEFYKSVAPKIKKVKKMGEKEYKEFMKNAVEKYCKAKKLSKKEADELMKKVGSSWGQIQKHF